MEKLSIIGCGTMGHSIALNIAWSKIPVKLQGIDEKDISRALTGIRSKLNILVQNNLLNEYEAEQILERITFTTYTEEAVAGCSFVIEAIPENLELKRKLFRKLDHICDQEVILASSTSGLSAAGISEDMTHRSRFIIAHFWNPAHLIPLVEIVPCDKTSNQCVDRSLTLMKAMGKKPIIVKKDIPGFVGNRLQFALFREAQYLLEEGVATKEDIDAAVTYSFGRRLPVTGPLASADLGGLDIFSSISDYLFHHLSNADGSFSLLKSLVNNNKLGEKTGEGYYTWDSSLSEKMNRNREIQLIRFLKQDMDDNS